MKCPEEISWRQPRAKRCGGGQQFINAAEMMCKADKQKSLFEIESAVDQVRSNCISEKSSLSQFLVH